MNELTFGGGGFLLFVVVPAGLMMGSVGWAIVRKGRFLGLVLAALVGMVGAMVGFFATPALTGHTGTGAMTVGVLLGSILTTAMLVVSLWRSPRPIDDPHSTGANRPIYDPHAEQPGRPPLRSSHV